MDDQAPSAPRRTRPPQQGRQKSSRAPGALSRESRFIGYLVLGFGVLAVVAVLILAFSNDKLPPVPEPVAIETAQESLISAPDVPLKKQDPNDLMAALDVAKTQTRPSRPSANQSKLAFARQEKIPVEQIAGAWQAMIGSYTAVAELDGKVYQIILASADPNAERIYSSGTYAVSGDLITFTPQTHWPSPDPGGKFVSYSMLTRASFSFAVAFQKGYMYWQNAPDTETQIYTTPKSPLFLTQKVNYVVWKKVSR